jgi:peptidoglycan hydrolase CwlO-like protein
MSEHIIKALLKQNDELKEQVSDLQYLIVQLMHDLRKDPADIEKLKDKLSWLESDMKALGEKDD